MNASLATRNAPRSAEINATGVLDSRMLPDAGFDALWDSIFVEDELKTRLLCQDYSTSWSGRNCRRVRSRYTESSYWLVRRERGKRRLRKDSLLALPRV